MSCYISRWHGCASLLKVDKNISTTKLLPLTFVFLLQNTRSYIMYAHTSHALILADFLFSFEWIWNNTIKKNDVNFFWEKEAIENTYIYMYMNICSSHTTTYLLIHFRFMVQLLFRRLTHGYEHNTNYSIDSDPADPQCLRHS